MLLLIDADRHEVGLVEQNVCRHEGRVCEKACVDILRVLCALVLKLRHSRKLAEHRVAVEHPAKLRVSGHVRLYEKGVLRFVKAASHVERERFVGASAKLRGYLTHGYGVQVDHAVECFVFLGESRKILDRSEIVSDGEVSRGLNARENDFLVCYHKTPRNKILMQKLYTYFSPLSIPKGQLLFFHNPTKRFYKNFFLNFILLLIC